VLRQEATMKLYTHPFSTYARRVHIAALEKGIELEYEEVDLARRKNREEPYLSLHPYGRVPTLVDGDFVLNESIAILQYLEAVHPEPALQPEDARGRALVSMHMHLCDIEFTGPNYSAIFSKRFLPEDKWRPDEIERGRKAAARHLSVLNGQLEGRQFLVAERFSLADLCYIPFLHFLPLIEVEVPKEVARWSESLLQRGSAKATVPPM
jgi:glutathione S-transferase